MLSFIKITYIIIGHVLINQSTASRISINKNSNVTRNWLENLEKSNSKFFDKRSSLEFICNYNGSGVFSPVCCETTFLLGVVGDSVEQSTKAFVKKHTEEPSYNLGYISARGIMKVFNNVYIAEENFDLYPEGMNGYTNVFYEGNDAERLVEEHNRWFETTSQGNLRTLITNKHFTNRHRIYSTVAYFQENWEQEFNCKNTKKGNFTLEHGEVVERLYMNAYTRNFRCDTFKIGNVEYEIVAVPYAEKNKFSESFRYMIYIIPRGKSTISLSRAWAYFNSRTNNDIRGYISKMKVETINLQIPKIEVLKSVIDFRTVLPRHYSEIKVKTSAVAMETELGVFIKITEEGETATAHEPTVKTYCARKSFKADVPHIAFVYDIFLNRILFVIKDVGPQK